VSTFRKIGRTTIIRVDASSTLATVNPPDPAAWFVAVREWEWEAWKAGNEKGDGQVPGKKAHVKNEKQYEALKDKGMSKERAAKIANSPSASRHGGEKSHSSAFKSDASQGGTHAQKVAAGRKGGKATAKKH
jgi:hypothetical protein